VSPLEIKLHFFVAHLKCPIANLHFCHYTQAKKRMRRQAEPDGDTKTDEDEDEEGNSLYLAFEINQYY